MNLSPRFLSEQLPALRRFPIRDLYTLSQPPVRLPAEPLKLEVGQ
jgi:hypothetical protein